MRHVILVASVHARRAVAGVVALLCLSAIASAQTNYPAATATLAHGAKLQPCIDCGSGEEISHIGGTNRGTATFSVIVPATGLYPVTVSFNNNDDSSYLITVNTNTRLDGIFFKNARGTPSKKTVLLPLNAGTNAIMFGNAEEGSPALVGIEVASMPVEAARISGSIKDAKGRPLSGLEVDLTGALQITTIADSQGRYEFPAVPKGDYNVRPVSSALFSPHERHCNVTTTNADAEDFAVRKMRQRYDHVAQIEKHGWSIRYDLANGVADFLFDGKLIIPQAFAAVRVPETLASSGEATRVFKQSTVEDTFGRGVKYEVESTFANGGAMTQEFWLYKKSDYFLADVKVSRKGGVAANYMAPLVSHTPVKFLPPGDHRALWVPFDNDKWVRYDAVPFGQTVASHEVSALYDNDSREALVAGSIEHDVWKTGVVSDTSADSIKGLEIFGGFTSSKTRDVLPHGKISGETIRSPKIFIGHFSDWRVGLETYAQANAKIAPQRPWDKGVPFGWNSWGKLQFNLTYDKAIQVSDFFARELPGFTNSGTAYIGLDSGWNKLTDEQLKQFVDHCHANHQEAGIYFTPFTAWTRNGDQAVDGTEYHYRDLYLYARGEKQRLDGGVAIDPTHPGTQARIKAEIERFKRAGFTYVKADFMTHGSLEADKYFDPKVTTGMQAYNEGMRFVSETLGTNIYLNLSISPLFPAQYADSRRIACDTFGDAAKTEYMLNSLAYGWWLNGVYDFNDADHIVLSGYTENENHSRTTSSAITGIFISGDDFSKEGDPIGKERAKQFLTNPDIDALARIRKSFRPVEGNTGDHAANLYSFAGKNAFYLAAFNYSGTNVTLQVDLERTGFQSARPVKFKELWHGTTGEALKVLNVPLGPTDAAIYRFDWPKR